MRDGREIDGADDAPGISQGKVRQEGAGPGMRDDDGAVHLQPRERLLDDRRLASRRGRSRAVDALAPAMAGTVEGDDAVAFRQPIAEGEHRIRVAA